MGSIADQPDATLVLGGMMTSGQFLSLFMVAVGVGFLVAAKLLPGKVKAELDHGDTPGGR